MGLFDWVSFKTKCPNCGTLVDCFQSKDWHCTLETIPYWYVDRFYSSCPNCKIWIEYRRIGTDNLPPYRPIEDYEVVTFK